MEGIANPAFEGDQLSDADSNANEPFSKNNRVHQNNNETLQSNNDVHPKTLQVAIPDPPNQKHYSTLGHPVRHLLKVDKICNSAPCTLDKKALKVMKQSDHNAPMYIITEPWVTNSSIFVQSRHVLPSPTLRAHELGILATPLVVGVTGPNDCKSKSLKTESQTNGVHTVNGLDSEDLRTHLDTISLRYHNMGRRKGRMERRRVWSRRLLILSVLLVIFLLLVIVAIVISIQMIDQQHSNETTQATISTTEAVP